MSERLNRRDGVTISPDITLLQAIKRMDEVRCKLLLVIRDGRFMGLLSIGDIQRAIIRNVAMSEPAGSVLRPEIVVCHAGEPPSRIRGEMLRCRAAFMPVLNSDGTLADVVFWEDLFADPHAPGRRDALNLPVVIMAGGSGTRLRPLTHVLPKPLLPFGKKTILETIMDRFVQAGCTKFHLSLNYKANMIRSYLAERQEAAYDVSCFVEDKPLGTAGSLSLIAASLTTPFFVSNCDIVIEQDLADVWEYHRANKNELTVVAALKHIKLAYGSLITGEDGLLQSLSEKPEWVFKVNSGVYILEPHLLPIIPENTFFNMTDLMDAIIHRKGRVGVFPVSEGSWSDIGNWDDYKKCMELHG